MAIDVLEIRNADREMIGVIDAANSIIWHAVYYGVGDFEIYARLTPEHLTLLQEGNYVTRNDVPDVGIIEHINISFDAINGYMITASGRFAKSILDRRLIYNLAGYVNTPTILSGNVEVAARVLVLDNAINCQFDTRRNIPFLALGALKNLPKIIVDEEGNPAQKQVSFENLLEYGDALLQEYEYAARVELNNNDKNLLYVVFEGTDRSVDNTAGNQQIIFSTDFDNLNSSAYDYDTQALRNAALIGGEGEGLERFFERLTGEETGLQLRELWIDASGTNRKYQTLTGEATYTDEEYSALLKQIAKQRLANYLNVEKFSGEINVTFGNWIYGRDFFLGDIVTMQDNKIGKYANVRIIEATEVQDENGYTVNVVYG